MADSSKVTAAKPKAAGAIYAAPLGTTVPTDATTALDNKVFKNLGYVSEDGVTNADERSSEDIKAWGGDIVNSVQTEKKDSFSYTLIEALNEEVLKEVYGSENVTGTLAEGIHIKVNSRELEEHIIVIDMVLKSNALKRIVLPNAKVTEVGEITYADGDNVGYQTTVVCFPDAGGDTHHEYIKAATK